MKVSQIVNLCNEMCNLQLPQNCDSVMDAKAAMENETSRKLIVCCNSVLEDLYCNYCTAIATCNVSAKNGFVDTSGIRLNRVLKLVDNQGENVRYRYTAEGLFANDGEYVLTYAKLPPTVEWDSEVALPSPRLTERILVYGILSEYFWVLEDLQLASAWETRYQNALHAASIKNSSMTLPVVKWL